MPAFPDELPPDGLNVNVTLTNGVTLIGLYTEGQWWVGVPDQAEDVPLNNEYVASWSLIE